MVYDYNLNVGTSSEEDIAKSLEAVKSGIEELKREFGALAGEDEASFAPFVNLYNEIVERADKAIADAENGEADE
jgi:formiminotetrahydrofolate cyclodeaminase